MEAHAPTPQLLEAPAMEVESRAVAEAELAYERSRQQREVIEQRLQAEIERLQLRLSELNEQLERLREED